MDEKDVEPKPLYCPNPHCAVLVVEDAKKLDEFELVYDIQCHICSAIVVHSARQGIM